MLTPHFVLAFVRAPTLLPAICSTSSAVTVAEFSCFGSGFGAGSSTLRPRSICSSAVCWSAVVCSVAKKLLQSPSFWSRYSGKDNWHLLAPCMWAVLSYLMDVVAFHWISFIWINLVKVKVKVNLEIMTWNGSEAYFQRSLLQVSFFTPQHPV